MNLWLLRHAIAAPRGRIYPRDGDRPLTPEGRRKMRAVARAMRDLDLTFDVILSSPLLRAKQTAEIVAKEFKVRSLFQSTPTLAPDGKPKELIDWLKNGFPSAASVLLVGHEPCLSELISLLVSGTPQFDVTLKKAGLVRLAIESLRFGRCATLEWLLPPRVLLRESGPD